MVPILHPSETECNQKEKMHEIVFIKKLYLIDLKMVMPTR